MKPGVVVSLIDASGVTHPATVVGVVGTGASGIKRCDVVVDSGAVVADAPHAIDAEPEEPCWTFPGEAVTRAVAASPESHESQDLHAE